jgi:hypothetical protein
VDQDLVCQAVMHSGPEGPVQRSGPPVLASAAAAAATAVLGAPVPVNLASQLGVTLVLNLRTFPFSFSKKGRPNVHACTRLAGKLGRQTAPGMQRSELALDSRGHWCGRGSAHSCELCEASPSRRAAPRRASADLVAERCDAAVCPELGEKRKCAACA